MTGYPIGVAGRKWGAAERRAWRSAQSAKRSYHADVVANIERMSAGFDVRSYGRLEYEEGSYPLLSVRSPVWSDSLPVALVTGGVHGYETSGVHGAIQFLETRAGEYTGDFNLLVAPCVSPWAYETINRWNPEAVDPNRSFVDNSPARESAALMALLADTPGRFAVHIDLHETTDTDNTEFRPALAARDGVAQDNWNIPDGFYLVGDTDEPAPDFQAAIIAGVEAVTHIAPPDNEGRLIGVPLAQPGVINYATRALGLCAGVTPAAYRTTTEVYPDSPRVDAENCTAAQVAAVVSGLDYVRRIGV